MRTRSLCLVLIASGALGTWVAAAGAAQAPGGGAGAQGAAQAPGVHGNLAQVMRGILFPNSNVIFTVQTENPASFTPAPDPATSPDPLTGAYGGWAAVENSGIALAEAANLLVLSGRLCENGRPVPIQNADWQMWVEGLREAGMAAYKAAQSKNQEAILDAAGVVSDACANCHTKYRDVASDAMRCQ